MSALMVATTMMAATAWSASVTQTGTTIWIARQGTLTFGSATGYSPSTAYAPLPFPSVPVPRLVMA